MDDVEESPIVTIYPIFNRSDYDVVYDNAYDKQYAIQIGVIDDSTHYGVDGALSYFTLFSLLESDGYDPLYPIRSEKTKKAKEHAGRVIGNIIASLAKTNSSRYIYSRVASYAKEICSFVKDYIYGSQSVPSFGTSSSFNKAPLAQETLYKRRSKQKENPSLYGGAAGIEEPLYETGELCDAIKWRLVPVDVVSGPVVAKRSRRKSAASAREAEKRMLREAKGIKSTKQMRRADDTRNERKAASKKKKALESEGITHTRDEWLKKLLPFYLNLISIKKAGYIHPQLGPVPPMDINNSILRYEKEAYSYGITREELKGFKS